MKKTLAGLLVLVLATTALAVDLTRGSDKPLFELRSGPFGADNTVVVRFHETSGRSWLLDGKNWVVIGGADVAPGDGPFDVQVISSGQSAQDSWYCFRIHRRTGKSWRLEGSNWAAISDPPSN